MWVALYPYPIEYVFLHYNGMFSVEYSHLPHVVLYFDDVSLELLNKIIIINVPSQDMTEIHFIQF